MIQKKFNTQGLAKFFETKKPLIGFGLVGLLLGMGGVYDKRSAGFAEMLGAFDSGISVGLSLLAIVSVYLLVSEKKERAQRHKKSIEQMEQNANKKGALLIFVSDEKSAVSSFEQAKQQMKNSFSVQEDNIEPILISKDRISINDMYEIKEKTKQGYNNLVESGVDLIYIAGKIPLPVAFMLGDEFGNQTPCIFCHFESGKYEKWYETSSGLIASPDVTVAEHFHPAREFK